MAITQQKLQVYKVLVQRAFENILTSSQISMAKSEGALKMLESESSNDGSVDKLDTYLTWIKTKPLAMKYFSTDSVFEKVIDGTVSFTTAAAGDPSTYIALHAEDTDNEPILDGLIALRRLGVDPTFKDDGANLGAGSAGTVYTDANVMGLHTTWGATKYSAIMNTGVLQTIKNDSDTNYDTINEVAAVYSAWTNSVSVSKFFSTMKKMVDNGVTTLKFSDLMTYADDTTNFAKYTSDNAIKLMASTGGSWAAVTGLSSTAFDDLTSKNAIKAITDAGADFTTLNTIYTASTDKFDAMISDEAINLVKKGYITFSNLSSGYGTTYTTAADVKFNTIVDTNYEFLFKNGVSYTNLATAYDDGKLNGFTSTVNKILLESPSDYNGAFAALVGMDNTSDFAGFELLGVEFA